MKSKESTPVKHMASHQKSPEAAHRAKSGNGEKRHNNHPGDAADLCVREVAYVHKSAALNEAARQMREMHVGSLVVVEESGADRLVVGMLTDRDIVTAVVARDLSASTLRVEDVMSADVTCAREHDSVDDVLSAMRRKGVRRMPVTGPRGQLVGLLAADDLLGRVSDELHTLVQAIAAQPRMEAHSRP